MTYRWTIQEWVKVRIQHCEKLAASKSDDEREGWLEDIAYFRTILEILEESPRSCNLYPGSLKYDA
jgi:hypothetical protein